ncbi:MAG: thioredoxin domain-containing protein [Alphaproteobacteria bacterium]|nr:thioredoxin domain-containing protein [Alphaproteobacteria bacterium]
MTIRTILPPIAAAFAAIVLAACSQGGGNGADANVKIDPYLADVTMGQETAPVTIVEYASLTCPHCRDFWKQEFPRLKADYIDTGKVKYTLRELPTPPVDVAIAAAAIARCTGKDHYYDVIEDVYSNYREMMDATSSPKGAASVLVEIGGRHGLSPEQVAACARSQAVQDYVNKEIAEKPAYANSTPTLILDGEQVTDLRYDNLKTLIDAKLNPGAAPAETPAPAPETPAKPAD